jgi:hypothetical protein
MRKIFIIIFSCVAVSIVSAITIGHNSAGESVRQDPIPDVASRKNVELSDHATYDFFFRNIVRLRQKTSELQATGKITRKPYFPMKKDIGLTDDQVTILEGIAFAARRAVAEQDERTKAIIATFQARFPGGKVPQGGSPPPPPELKAMWKERETIILRARDQLKASLGEKEFARVDNYAKTHVVAVTKD